MEYDPKVLRKLQLAECKILEDFIKICDDNGLDYFIEAGCAIGVERHGGFIPWDDDIDIGMLRKDYEKFKQIAVEQYSDKYTVFEIGLDPEFPFLNMEFKRNGTRNMPVIFKGCKTDIGIDVAIYPYDNVADKPWARRFQLAGVFFWHKIKILREFGHPVLFMSGFKRKAVSAICVTVHALLKFFRVPHSFINRMYLKHALKYNDTETEYVANFFVTTPMEESIKRSEIYPLQERKFEYLTVKVPNKNHDFLTREFGDYMQLPPPEKRKNHVPYILEFGPFEDLETDC